METKNRTMVATLLTLGYEIESVAKNPSNDKKVYTIAKKRGLNVTVKKFEAGEIKVDPTAIIHAYNYLSV